MPSFDATAQTIWLRVVFDGLAGVGKTTTVHALAELFEEVREGSVVSPDSAGRATPFFDWLELRAGQLFGHPVRVLVLSVPGQAALSERRWVALEGADACVLVCDAAGPIEHAKLALSFLRDASPRSDVPFVVQANKVDLPGALTPVDLADRLGLNREVVYAASAASLKGVRDMLLRAVALARDSVTEAYKSIDEMPVGRPQPHGLLARLQSVEHAAEGGRAVSLRETVLDRWRNAAE